jgi:hypothetical protein
MYRVRQSLYSTMRSINPSISRPTREITGDTPSAKMFLPPLPPPEAAPPTFPVRPPLPVPPGYQRTQHVLPASDYRRYETSYGTLSRESRPFEDTPSRSNASKEERQEHVVRGLQKMWDMVRSAKKAVEPPETCFWVSLERWVRKERSQAKGKGKEEPQGVTLVVTHANGMNKEVSVSGAGEGTHLLKVANALADVVSNSPQTSG